MGSKNVLALTFWSYKDALVQSAVMPYLRMIRRHRPGAKIFLVTLEQSHFSMSPAEAREARAFLVSVGVELLTIKYTRFGLRAGARWALFIPSLLALCYREKISHVHAWGPCAGGIGYVLSALAGATLILDSYEPHAESMVEVGSWERSGAAFRVLFLLERLQARRARAAIATARGVREYAKEKYGASFERFYVKPATVDLNMFAPRHAKDPALLREYGLEGKLVCVYAGKIGGIYLEQEIFDFFKVASDYWGERFRVLLLTDAARERVEELAAAAGLDPGLVISRFVPFESVPRHMGLGDFAINPVKPVPTKRYCTSVKDGEYWAMGLPVVIPPNISDDSDIISENRIGAVIKSFGREGYLEAVREIDELLRATPREELSRKIRGVADKYRNVVHSENIYREIYGTAGERAGAGRLRA